MTYARVALVREELRNRIYLEVLEEVLAALESIALDPIVLGGATVASAVYPMPSLRHNHAIELLIERAGLDAARAALVRVGLRDGGADGMVHATGLPVTLRTSMLNFPWASDPPGIRARASRMTVASRSVPALDCASTLTYVIGRAAFAPTTRNLRWVMDAARVIERLQVDWPLFAADTAATGLSPFYTIALEFLADDLLVPVSGPARALIASSPVDHAMVTRVCAALQSALVTHGRAWRALPPDLGLRGRYLTFAALPPARWLEWRYGLATASDRVRWHASRPARVIARRLRPGPPPASSGHMLQERA
jgi:hypothetical protein